MQNFVGFALASMLALIGCSTSGLTSGDGDGDGDRVSILGVDVFDPVSGALIPDQAVVIADGKIVSVGPTSSNLASMSRTINGRGLTLLPGLINAHVHVQSSQDAATGLRDLLQRGVTSVRDLGGDIRPLRELNRRASEEGLAIPDIYYSAVVAGPKHMADPRAAESSEGFEPGTAPWMRAYAKGDDVAAIVAEAKATGATGIKIYASLEGAQLAALTAEAKAQGLQVWTHSVMFPANAADVIASRPTQIIHTKGLASRSDGGLPDNFGEGVRTYMSALPFSELDPAKPPFPSMFAAMKANGILLEPALMADGDLAISQGRELPPPLLAMRDWTCRATREAFRAGVSIGAGTDYHGEGELLLMELERMHACGMPRAAVLTAATLNNAAALGIGDRVGQVAAGYQADLLLVEGNPRKDLAALREVRYVFKHGKLVRAPRDFR